MSVINIPRNFSLRDFVVFSQCKVPAELLQVSGARAEPKQTELALNSHKKWNLLAEISAGLGWFPATIILASFICLSVWCRRKVPKSSPRSCNSPERWWIIPGRTKCRNEGGVEKPGKRQCCGHKGSVWCCRSDVAEDNWGININININSLMLIAGGITESEGLDFSES